MEQPTEGCIIWVRIKDQDLLLDHDYDGIKEYDNPLPTWWLITFWNCHFGFFVLDPLWIWWCKSCTGAWSGHEGSANASRFPQNNLQQRHRLKQKKVKILWRRSWIKRKLKAQRKTLCSVKCASCHGPELQGLVGPNLVDKAWIHGKGPWISSKLFVKSPDKGMPAWASMMSVRLM